LGKEEFRGIFELKFMTFILNSFMEKTDESHNYLLWQVKLPAASFQAGRRNRKKIFGGS